MKKYFIALVSLMQLSCSGFVMKEEWKGIHSQPWDCPKGYVNVRIMKEKWVCQPDVWWGIEDRGLYF